jgi:hypothetical protein
MQFLATLWLPILLAAVFVFAASFVIHMLIPIHKADYKGVANEAPLLDAVRAQNLAPGEYYFPWCATMKEMNSPDFVERRTRGPVGILTVMPSGPPSMTKNLVQWFIMALVVGIFTAYVAMLALAPGAGFSPVFRVTATVAALAYATAYVNNSIWKGTPWGATWKFVFDGLVYGAVTGATFAWLWPEI